LVLVLFASGDSCLSLVFSQAEWRREGPSNQLSSVDLFSGVSATAGFLSSDDLIKFFFRGFGEPHRSRRWPPVPPRGFFLALIFPRETLGLRGSPTVEVVDAAESSSVGLYGLSFPSPLHDRLNDWTPFFFEEGLGHFFSPHRFVDRDVFPPEQLVPLFLQDSLSASPKRDLFIYCQLPLRNCLELSLGGVPRASAAPVPPHKPAGAAAPSPRTALTPPSFVNVFEGRV